MAVSRPIPEGRAAFALMLLGDARLPTGSHTQSAGLEAALSAGMPGEDIPAYVQMRLRTTALVDAATAVAALAVLTGRTPATLPLVHQHWAARTPSHIQRQASIAVGRGLFRLLDSLFPDEPTSRAVGEVRSPSRPLVLAGFAKVLSLGPAELAALVCYDEVQTITAAALKLWPLDPAHSVRWALDARPMVDAVADQVASISDPAEIPATSTPLMDQWIHAHSRATRRLFSA
jgi:urease accessory protein